MLKFLTMMGMGREIHNMPQMAHAEKIYVFYIKEQPRRFFELDFLAKQLLLLVKSEIAKDKFKIS